MELILLKCKNCGADLSVDKDAILRCKYCGSEQVISTVGETKFSIKFGELVGVESASGEVRVPNGVISIGKRAFADCGTLKNVILPETVMEIGEEAFINAAMMSHINLPRNLLKIGNRAFKGSGLKTIVLNKTLKAVGEEAFMNCENLTSAVIEKGFSYNLIKCFKGCKNLVDVNCEIDDFYLSFKRGIETNRRGSPKPTIFDAFQGTSYFHNIYNKCIVEHTCLFCGNKIKPKFISFSSSITCKQCNYKFEY